jgi:hypothetical protein
MSAKISLGIDSGVEIGFAPTVAKYPGVVTPSALFPVGEYAAPTA